MLCYFFWKPSQPFGEVMKRWVVLVRSNAGEPDPLNLAGSDRSGTSGRGGYWTNGQNIIFFTISPDPAKQWNIQIDFLFMSSQSKLSGWCNLNGHRFQRSDHLKMIIF